MSHVDFKKWQCPLSLILNVPVDFKVPQCRMSILRNGPVALSNLRVKGPHTGCIIHRCGEVCSTTATPNLFALTKSRVTDNPQANHSRIYIRKPGMLLYLLYLL